MKKCVNIIFMNDEHMEAFFLFMKQARVNDCYTQSLLYLLAMDSGTRANINRLYDFEANRIKFDGLCEAWQSHSSLDATRMAFNLFNGFHGFGWEDGRGETELDCPSEYTPYGLFHRLDYQPYYFQAIRLRYPS